MTILVLSGEIIGLVVIRIYLAHWLVRLVNVCGGSRATAIWIYSVITLPGILLHEMAHFIVAVVIGFRTGTIELLPTLHSDGSIELGSVQVEKGDPIRHALVGLAPFLFGLAGLIWLLPFIQRIPLIAWFTTSIALHMTPSRRDMSAWPVAVVLLSLFGGLAVFLGIRLPNLLQLTTWCEQNLIVLSRGLMFAGLISIGLLTGMIGLYQLIVVIQRWQSAHEDD